MKYWSKIVSFIAYIQPPATIKTALISFLIGAVPMGFYLWRSIYFPIGNYTSRISLKDFEAMQQNMAKLFQSPLWAFAILSLLVLIPLFCFFFGYLVLVLSRLTYWGWQQWIRKS